MPSIHEEYAQRRKLVSAARWDEITERVRSFMGWMLAVPRIASIVEDVERAASIDDMLRRKKPRMPPPTGSPAEVARLGVYILKHVYGGHDFANLVLDLDIRNPYGANNAQLVTHEGLSRYVDPALDYIDHELRTHESRVTPEAVLEERVEVLFGPRFSQDFPATAKRIQMVAHEIARADSSTQWSSVSNSCRQCLLEFIAELRGRRSMPSTGLKDDDFKGHAKAILAAARNDADSSERLEKLVTAAWDYVQEVTHKRPADREHAQIAFTWTALSIFEVWRLAVPIK